MTWMMKLLFWLFSLMLFATVDSVPASNLKVSVSFDIEVPVSASEDSDKSAPAPKVLVQSKILIEPGQAPEVLVESPPAPEAFDESAHVPKAPVKSAPATASKIKEPTQVNRVSPSSGLKVASFNIEVLGVSKMDKPEVVAVLVKIMARYDLILVQEYRDKSQTAVVELLEELNAYVGSNQYEFVMGARVGRTSSKEQQIYFYKPSKLSVTDAYDYVETEGDVFEREPYIVRFNSPTTQIKDFAFINIHVKPDDAVSENDYLAVVYDDAVKKYGTPNVIVSGDLNADCNYVRDDDWANIRLRSDSRFYWIIPDDADTTVNGNTHCAYDRWVVNKGMKDVITNIGVFYFDAEYGLDYYSADAVSDHYPIEMTIN